MDLKTYEKTRYQNIYRHKKNKNYLIMISKPAKTSISRIDGKKIIKLEDALKIRDNPKIKYQKGTEATYKELFDDLWTKYMDDCKDESKQAYNTLIRKQKTYNKYLKEKFKKRVSKITKEDILLLIKNENTTDKQKNQILKVLKAFFNWCIEKEYLINSPAKNIKKIKISKKEMKFWTPEELEKVLKVLNKDMLSKEYSTSKKARLMKLFIIIEFSLGNRVGETRALTYNCFNKQTGIVQINHSINYDRKSDDFLSHTKNYQSQREIDITDKVIDEVNNYKKFLIDYTNHDIKDSDLLFFNYSTKKPYSDSYLRQLFHYYCGKANVTKIRMYDLRHTYVTIMMAEGKELYQISSRIGHKSYSTTVDKYGHLSTQTRKEVAKITDKYI